jgi:hypothetical protein|tara:strand:- start:741 stop:848 length:108 start_codon:yes stop_codon:yes gene_type:complete
MPLKGGKKAKVAKMKPVAGMNKPKKKKKKIVKKSY